MDQDRETTADYRVGGTQEEYKIKISDHILDSIYGQIGITEVERKLERLPIFKRLHNISQLGLVNWIFPCALHTRYIHSIGVMHVASEMATHINTNLNQAFFDDSDIQIIRLAGMLHDIGHYPMSHNVEQAYKDASDTLGGKKNNRKTPLQNLETYINCPKFLNPLRKKEPGAPQGSEAEREIKKDKMLKAEEKFLADFGGSEGFHHEKIGSTLICRNVAIRRTVKENFVLLKIPGSGEHVLNPKFAPVDENGVKASFVSEDTVDKITAALMNAIGEMVRGNYTYRPEQMFPWLDKYSAMIQLIHSDLDADNLDYLLRDATFSGTSYGIMDMGVLLNCLTVAKLRDCTTGEESADYRYIVGVKEKGLGCVEQFLINKFLAYSQMILSKYVSILEAMLLRIETDYMIPEENNYTCDKLENMVNEGNPSVAYSKFSDHYIFQQIYELRAHSRALRGLPAAIVSRLENLSAFDLCSQEKNECLCTGFSEDEILKVMGTSEVYQRFRQACKQLKNREAQALKHDASEDKKLEIKTRQERTLFAFRFEQYSLTKQIPLEQFVNMFNFSEMHPERKFHFHYYRMGNGIPVLKGGHQYAYHGSEKFEEFKEGEKDLPLLCVDCVQSCLHFLYRMKYVSLREYEIAEMPDEA